MKRFIALATSLLMLVGCFCVTAFAEGELSADVYVTIANKGSLVVAQEKITVTDIDDDGALTINDALYAAHEAKYEGGAEAGYSSYSGEYGLSIGMLWGEDSGSFGYYVNNASAWGLSDAVKEGDLVYAFVYSDATAWSDTYSYFDVAEVSVEAGKDISLILSAAGYDENWNPITVAVEGATITVDGVATEVKTDAAGKATIQIAEGGKHIISATSESVILVPPVCVVEVNEADSTPESTPESTPDAGDASTVIVFVLLAVSAFAGVAVISAAKKN